MDLALLVYAVSLLDKIHGLLVAGCIVTGALAVALYLYRFAECSEQSYYNEAGNAKRRENGKWAVGYANKFIVGCITITLAMIAIPTEKTAYMMLGAYAAQKVAENSQVADVSGKIMKIVNAKLDSYVEDAIEQATNPPEPKRKK